MSNPIVPGVGGVPSADIAVPEHARELQFYVQVLTTGERPLWRDDLMNSRGTPVIGLGERTPEYEALPLQWMPHIQVADVAASVARALELGGTEIWHGKDDDGNSLWAALGDPGGAAFGIIPRLTADSIPPQEAGADDASAGRIAAVRLVVPDADKVRAFYRDVVGWNVRGDELLDEHGACAGSITAAGDAALPPVWLLELPVGDLVQSVERARAGGGEVLHQEASADGRLARVVVRDPVGVALALVVDEA